MIAIAYLIIGTALIALSVGIVVLGVYLFSDDEGSEGVQTVLKFLYLFFGGFGLAISVAYLLPVSFEIGILLCAGAISLILALKKNWIRVQAATQVVRSEVSEYAISV